MEKVVTLLQRELEIARAQMEIRRHVESEIQGRQREAVLRQQLKYIQQELGLSKDDRTAELEKFRARIAERNVPAAAAQRIEDELGKLSTLEVGSPEYGVTRNYLDWLTSVPWGVASSDQTDLRQARRVLDQHHAGLADVKARMVEFLALGIMKGDVAGSIICLAGPPGVGKTSLGRAVAEALGRSFYRFSVGGMRDEAEIKGHRRTYIGAMPGKLIRALRDTGVANPVIMLDEIDKIGASYQGDPAAALLEALDPEQNSAFHDHYLDVDVDLSKVLFICTANQLDSIPAPLLDRMEVITLPGYLDFEKLAIARSSKDILAKPAFGAWTRRSRLSCARMSCACSKVRPGPFASRPKRRQPISDLPPIRQRHWNRALESSPGSPGRRLEARPCPSKRRSCTSRLRRSSSPGSWATSCRSLRILPGACCAQAAPGTGFPSIGSTRQRCICTSPLAPRRRTGPAPVSPWPAPCCRARSAARRSAASP
jgi:hypothetical protein